MEESDEKTEVMNILKNDKGFHRRLRNEIMMNVIPTNKNDEENQGKSVYYVYERVRKF